MSSTYPDAPADPAGFFSGLLGGPPTFISGPRTPAHNAAVGGSPTSEHIPGNGWAYDFAPPKGMTNAQAVDKIAASGVPFDQVWNEGNHVHFGVGPKMRGQALGGSQGLTDAQLQEDFAASQAQGATAPGGAPAAPPAHSPTAAPGMPGYGIEVEQTPDGRLRDAQGNFYTPGGVDSSGVRHGVYQEPTQDQLLEDYQKATGDKPGAPTPPAPQNPDIAGQFGRGAIEGIESTGRGVIGMAAPDLSSFLGRAADATDWIGGLMRSAFGAGVAPPRVTLPTLPQGGPRIPVLDDWIAQAPRTGAEKLARAAGDFLPAAATANPEGGVLPWAARAATAVGAPTLGSVGASEAVRALGGDDQTQQLAGQIGALGGAVAGHYVPQAAGAVAAAGGRAVAPFAAAVSPEAAAKQAGGYLASRATDPAAAISALGQPGEIVPGSMPTAFQQSGDMGLGAVERAVAAKNPDLFKQREAEQNAARVQALGGIQQGADPMAVQAHVKGALDALDASTERATDAARAAAQASVDATQAAHDRNVGGLLGAAQARAGEIGGTLNPDDYGAQIRSGVVAADEARAQTERGMYDAVDPDGTLTSNNATTRAAAPQILQAIPSTAKPLEGEQAAIFQAAADLPAIGPARDLIALRQRLNAEMSNELSANGRSPAYAVMSQLRDAMSHNLASTISDAVGSDNARVAAGELAPEDTVGARLARTFGFEPSQNQAGVSAPGNVGLASAAGGTSGPRGAGGTAGAPGGGFRGPSGNPGLESAGSGVAQAAEDIALLRRGQTGGLVRAMQELGGVKLRNPDGSAVPGPDIEGPLRDIGAPGAVNNRAGLSPEQMATALHERGFFGPNVEDPSAAFEAALAQHARGARVYPDASASLMRERLGRVDADASAAGVVSSDRLPVAAQKLAAYRSARNDLIDRAEQYGVPWQGRDLHEVWGDVAEREAIEGPASDSAGAEFDALAGRGRAPTFDDAARARLNAANAYHAEQAPKFGQPAIAGTLKTTGYKGQFQAPDAAVPGKFFHPGPTGQSDMAALGAVAPEALPAAHDFAAMTLRRAALRPDGTLDPDKFAAWARTHADAIRQLPPEQQARFANAAAASRAVADAEVARVAAVKAAQKEAAQRVVDAEAQRKATMTAFGKTAPGKLTTAQSPEEITNRVGTILRSPTRVSDMAALARATETNPDARAGLRQAIADHIASHYIGNTEAGTSGVNTMRADPFQSFVRQSAPALAHVFTPEEMQSMRAISDDLARSRRSQNAVKLAGSNTAQDAHGVAKLPGQGVGHAAGRVIFDMLAGGLGEHLLGHTGIGGELGIGAGEMANALRAHGIGKVNDLVTRAMLDPKLARTLMQKANGQLTPRSMQGGPILRALGVEQFSPPRKAAK